MGDKPELPEDLPEQKELSAPSADDQANSRAGTAMIIGTWVVLLGMLTWFGHRWYEQNFNPNQQVVTDVNRGKQSVSLQANRHGHYIASGSINNTPVVFMLDTGATGVSIPKTVAAKLDLDPSGEAMVNTANGTIIVQKVKIPSVAVGDLILRNVSGHINPYMSGDEVLLGMSYLRHFDLLQRGNHLTLSEP